MNSKRLDNAPVRVRVRVAANCSLTDQWRSGATIRTPPPARNTSWCRFSRYVWWAPIQPEAALDAYSRAVTGAAERADAGWLVEAVPGSRVCGGCR